MAKTKEYAFGVAQVGDIPHGPKLKGWIKPKEVMEVGKFYDFALWPSKTEKGGYSIEIREQWKKPGSDDYAQGATDATRAKIDYKGELDGDIPF